MKQAILTLSLLTIVSGISSAQNKIPTEELSLLQEACINGIIQGNLTEEQKTNYCKCSTDEINNSLTLEEYKLSSSENNSPKKKEVNQKIMSIALKCMEKHLKPAQ